MRSCRVLDSDHFTPAIYTEIVALESEADCLQLHRSFTALLEGYSECAGIVLLQREVQLQRAATLYSWKITGTQEGRVSEYESMQRSIALHLEREIDQEEPGCYPPW
jgi:hypothetical protein